MLDFKDPLNKLHLIYLVSIATFHLLISSFVLPIDDEMYYWTWSKDLAWGYFDHPPMIALFIAISSFLAKGFLGIRLMTIFAFSGTLVLWNKILKPTTQKDVHIFYWGFLSFVAFQIFGIVTTPDVPLLLFGSLYLFFLKRCIIYQKTIINFIGLALAMALTMYSKYMGLLLIGFSLLPLIPVFYKNKYAYLAIVLSLILYLPALYWQQNHDWISVNYHLFDRVRQNDFSFEKMLNYLLGFISFGSLLLYTIPYKKLNFNDLFNKSLLFIAVGGFLFFFVNSFNKPTQAQWNLIIYMALWGLIYPFLKMKGLSNWRFKLSVVSGVLMLITAIVLCFPGIRTPMSNLKNFVLETKEITNEPPVFERYQQTAAYQYYVGEEVYCYRVYNHRRSQYDLWNDEGKMQNKDLTFLGLEKLSDNEIQDNYGKTEFYSLIRNFRSFPQVEISEVDAQYDAINHEVSITFLVENPYHVPIDLKKGNQTLVLMGFNEKGHPVFIKNLEFSTIFEPEQELDYSLVEKFALPDEISKYGLGLRPKGVSAKMQSDYFQFQIYNESESQ